MQKGAICTATKVDDSYAMKDRVQIFTRDAEVAEKPDAPVTLLHSSSSITDCASGRLC